MKKASKQTKKIVKQFNMKPSNLKETKQISYEEFVADCLRFTEDLINFTRSYMSEAEQLSKRPNTSSTWECFTKEEKLKKGSS